MTPCTCVCARYILGLPFLRQFFSVFDYTKLQVSFYISKQGFCG